jgi:hypothetical protein
VVIDHKDADDGAGWIPHFRPSDEYLRRNFK